MWPTVVLFLCSVVVFLCIFCKIRPRRLICHCNGQFTSAVCVSVRLCFYSTIHYFAHCFLLFHVGIVNIIILVILFCLVFWLANCSPQDPIIQSSPAQSPRADIVPVLGTTPSIATLLGKRPEGSAVKWLRLQTDTTVIQSPLLSSPLLLVPHLSAKASPPPPWNLFTYDICLSVWLPGQSKKSNLNSLPTPLSVSPVTWWSLCHFAHQSLTMSHR